VSASRGHTMGRQQLGVQLARFLYAIAAFVALVAAAGAVAPLVTGAPGGCRVVITLGAPVALGRSGIGSPTQTSPGPSAPGLPAVCEQYLDLRLPALAGVVAVVLVLTTIRLGREPESWGLTIVVGATVGIVAALATSYAILGIVSSDQLQHSPGPGELLIASAPVLAALASTLAVWRAYESGRAAAKRLG